MPQTISPNHFYIPGVNQCENCTWLLWQGLVSNKGVRQQKSRECTMVLLEATSVAIVSRLISTTGLLTYFGSTAECPVKKYLRKVRFYFILSAFWEFEEIDWWLCSWVTEIWVYNLFTVPMRDELTELLRQKCRIVTWYAIHNLLFIYNNKSMSNCICQESCLHFNSFFSMYFIFLHIRPIQNQYFYTNNMAAM